MNEQGGHCCNQHWGNMMKFCGECGSKRPEVKAEVSEDDVVALAIVNASRGVIGRPEAKSLSDVDQLTREAALSAAHAARELFGAEADRLRAELATKDARHAGLADSMRAQGEELAEAKRQLAIVQVTGHQGVWYWQGHDDDATSLVCPVVMAADTLRKLVLDRDAYHAREHKALERAKLHRREAERLRARLDEASRRQCVDPREARYREFHGLDGAKAKPVKVWKTDIDAFAGYCRCGKEFELGDIAWTNGDSLACETCRATLWNGEKREAARDAQPPAKNQARGVSVEEFCARVKEAQAVLPKASDFIKATQPSTPAAESLEHDACARCLRTGCDGKCGEAAGEGLPKMARLEEEIHNWGEDQDPSGLPAVTVVDVLRRAAQLDAIDAVGCWRSWR